MTDTPADKRVFSLFLLAIVVVSFTLGVYLSVRDAFPAGTMIRLYKAYQHWISRQHISNLNALGHFWFPNRFGDQKGTTVYDQTKTYGDLTLFTYQRTGAKLIDHAGNVVYSWHVPHEDVWPERVLPDDHPKKEAVVWHYAKVFPNGDILTTFTGWYGERIGMIKIDKDSTLLWKYDGWIHHKQDIGPDDVIYALSFEVDLAHPLKVAHTPIRNDFVLILTPEGTLMKKISIHDAFLNSPYYRMLKAFPAYTLHNGDITHTNDIEYITESMAEAMPFLTPGHLLLSVRHLDTIAVMDPEEETIVWTMQGAWRFQHDPDILPNGRMLIFDNNGSMETGAFGPSRVIEVDPLTRRVLWEYSGTDERPLMSKTRGAQQRLPNGNTLITESHSGRLLEITREGEIVWEYINPDRRHGTEGTEYIGLLNNAHRFRYEELPFLAEMGIEKPKHEAPALQETE